MTLPSATWAQGTIDGLGGARVEIPALDIIAFTGPDGSFALSGVAGGTHTIEVRLIGFGLLTEDVAVTSGQTTEIELMLDIVAGTVAPELPGLAQRRALVRPAARSSEGYAV